MNKDIFNIDFEQPYIDFLGGFKPWFIVKDSKLSKIKELNIIPNSYFIGNLFAGGFSGVEYSSKYRFNKVKKEYPSLEDSLIHKIITLYPGEVIPSQNYLSFLSSIIITMGGVWNVSRNDIIKINEILIDCYNSIDDRFPNKTDLLLSLKESGFNENFLKNLESWNFEYPSNSVGSYKFFEYFTNSLKEEKYHFTTNKEVLVNLFLSEYKENFEILLKSLTTLGYKIVLSDYSGITVYWGSFPEPNSMTGFLKTKLSSIFKKPRKWF